MMPQEAEPVQCGHFARNAITIYGAPALACAPGPGVSLCCSRIGAARIRSFHELQATRFRVVSTDVRRGSASRRRPGQTHLGTVVTLANRGRMRRKLRRRSEVVGGFDVAVDKADVASRVPVLWRLRRAAGTAVASHMTRTARILGQSHRVKSCGRMLRAIGAVAGESRTRSAPTPKTWRSGG
jgi:hypothetical protein